MNDFLGRLKQIPNLMANAVNFFLDGLGKQLASFNGAVVLLIVGLLVLDVLAKGSLGIITFLIEKFGDILGVISSSLKDGGWPIIVAILVALLWKISSKSK